MKRFILSALLLIILSSFASAQSKTISVTYKNIAVPVFIEKDKNIICNVSVELKNAKDKFTISEIGYETSKFSSANILKSVGVFVPSGKKDSLIAEMESKGGKTGILKFSHSLKQGLNEFKFAVGIKENSLLDSLFRFKVSYLKINNKKYSIETRLNNYRVGHVIRKPGDFNVKSYRIPGLVRSNKGTLLAVYDIRKNGARDLPADIDVGLSRSTDNGQTWLPMQVIMDMGEPHDQNGIGDPSILVDRNSRAIWVAALWSKGNRGWNGSKPGLTPDETGQLMLTKSSDDGLTWSKPQSITPSVKNPKWNLFFQGPGNGITLDDGTLVFPAQYKDSTGMPYSTIIYSKDAGATWKVGNGAKSNTTEAQVVELDNGLLMLNMRDNRGGSRSVAVTSDMGKTWREHPTTRSALIEPVCMASFIRVFTQIPGRRNSVLAFSNPASRKNRDSLTVKFSINDGDSWGGHRVPSLLIDERESYGYSCLTKIDDKHLGLLYEGVDEIYFVKVVIPESVIKPDINDFEANSAIIKKSK